MICIAVVFPIGLPLLHHWLVKTKLWHISIMVASIVTAACTYFVVYDLVIGESSSEGALVAMFVPIFSGGVMLATSFVVWLVDYIKNRKPS